MKTSKYKYELGFVNKKNHLIICTLIFISLIVALMPVVLSNNYLRQDDLVFELWPEMKPSDFAFLYYNTVFQLVRPICMLLFYMTDLISINMHHSVYVRLASITLIGILGVMLYCWQLLFNSNKVLAAAFAIAGFTLPAYQLFAATANYFLIIFGLLLTTSSMFFLYAAYQARSNFFRIGYFISACTLFYFSLLDYPLSSMYAWVMLTICFINTPATNNKYFNNYLISENKFFNFACCIIASLMFTYFITIHYVHSHYQVDLSRGNSAVIDKHNITAKLFWLANTLTLQSHFWFYKAVEPLKNYFPILIISLLLSFALIKINLIQNIYRVSTILKNVILNLIFCAFLLILSYVPVLALPHFNYTFRYILASMPLILYLLFWSVSVLFYSSAKSKNIFSALMSSCASLFFICVTIFGVGYANLMTADGIVGPQTHDFVYLQNTLKEKVVPLLKQNKKVIIQITDCDNGNNYQFPPNITDTLEYGMRLCMFRPHIFEAISHSLMNMGYISNFHKFNDSYEINKGTILDTPWGKIIIVSDNSINLEKDYPQYNFVKIDMLKMPLYQHLNFYRDLFGTTQ